jgi:hypothetical protein
MIRHLHNSRLKRRASRSEGFSLVELVAAVGVFLVVGGAAISLYSKHETLLSQQQGIAGLNIGLRNALSQIQTDVVNAGYGLILGANSPAWPVGVTIYNSNPTSSTCNPTATTPATYAAACFDKLNVVVVDPNTPYLQIASSASCPAPFYTNGGQYTILSTETTTCVAGTPGSGTSATYYSNFKQGDYILLVKATGQQFTTAQLSAAGVNSSPNIQLTFDETQIGGFNYSPTSANDPLSMTAPYAIVNTTSGSTTVTWVSGNDFVTGNTWVGQQIQIANNNYSVLSVNSTGTSLTLNSAVPSGITQYSSVPLFTSQSLTNQFTTGDFVLRLLPIQYSVSVANASDPQLVRTQNGTSSVVMDQVIGFKVGAAFWNNSSSTFEYCYNTGAYCDAADTMPGYYSNFTLIRAVRVSIIGRTTPSSDPTYTYRNPFDNGPYQIRGNSIVVNPRNLTMNND